MSDLYIGFMSGTSCDGVDASLIETDGKNHFKSICNIHLPYSSSLRQQVKKLFKSPAGFLQTEKEITEIHIQATEEILKKTNYTAKDIKALGFHGQTIYHNPQDGISWQIGDAKLLSTKTNIDIIYDFRSNDIKNGGQGAPLIPIFHKLLLNDVNAPAAIINIGGVANITYKYQQELIAFDTGPGNALIDDAMQKFFNKDFDEDGAIAAQGAVDMHIIEKFMQDKYFSTNYPKSLDREHFNYTHQHIAKHAKHDQIAILTYFTACSIADSFKLLTQNPQQVYLCGGGARNKQLIHYLISIFKDKNINCKVDKITELGDDLDSDYIESAGFAYLAARRVHNLPSSYSTTTGAHAPCVCGNIYNS